MNKNEIKPHKITKPIQLLAAWLVGLIVINASFLTAAGLITMPWYLQVVLVLASTINVFVFVILLYLMQTHYREQMQDDNFYSKSLEQKFAIRMQELLNTKVELQKQEKQTVEELVEIAMPNPNENADSEIVREKISSTLKYSKVKNLVNKYSNYWFLGALVDQSFQLKLNERQNSVEILSDNGKYILGLEDIQNMYVDGLFDGSLSEIIPLKLSPLGQEVAQMFSEKANKILGNK